MVFSGGLVIQIQENRKFVRWVLGILLKTKMDTIMNIASRLMSRLVVVGIVLLLVRQIIVANITDVNTDILWLFGRKDGITTGMLVAAAVATVNK